MAHQMALPIVDFQVMAQQVLRSRRITREHQSYFMSAALSAHCLSDAEQVTFNRLFEALQRGLIRVVD